MNLVKLSVEAKRAVFCLLVRASLARHQSRAVEALGTAMGYELAADYRAENRHLLAMARDLVENDLFVQLKARTAYGECDCTNGCDACDDHFFYDRTGISVMKDRLEEKRDAATKVSWPAAPRELYLLCMLVQNREGTKSLPVHTLSRLRAPWAAVPRKWAVALPYPLFMRPAFGKAPTGTVLARCSGYRAPRAVRSNPRAVRLTGDHHVSPA